MYRVEDASRVLFVRRAQAMGLALDDIRELLELRSLKTPDQCHRVASRLRTRVSAVEQKIADLQAFREEDPAGCYGQEPVPPARRIPKQSPRIEARPRPLEVRGAYLELNLMALVLTSWLKMVEEVYFRGY